MKKTVARAILLGTCALMAAWMVCGAALVGGASVQADTQMPGADLVTPAPGTVAPAASPGERLIALTFDDGPRRSTTTRLLDGLAQRGVHATFFLIGAQVEGNEDVLRRMDDEGHQIGIHTYDHVKLTDLNYADFDAQVGRTRGLLKEVLGHNDFLLRPPYGLLDNSIKTWAGCPIILWSIDPEDWKDQDAARVRRHICENAQEGGIILLHDIFPASVDAALRVVDDLHAQGYLFCTIDDLFAARGIPLARGRSYWNAYP